MKSGDQNRFSKAIQDREQKLSRRPHDASGLEHIDVQGKVTREGSSPISVELYGQTFAFEGPQIVDASGRRWQLVQLEGRDALVLVR